MPEKKTGTKLRVLVHMALRQSSDPANPLYEQWHKWQPGEVFEPPAHMDVARSLARGIVEEVK